MTNDPPRILFYVQHLLGIGHLKRAATIARALTDEGFATTLVSGGQAVPGIDVGGAQFVQLSPVRAADKFFKVLVDDSGTEIDDAFRETRRRRLAEIFHVNGPDILITELFPFGRRQLGFELIPLLESAKAADAPPLVVCSVRDILVEPPKPERVAEMLDRVERYYDSVLVHGDPSLIPFDRTFGFAERIADRVRYTGYVVERAAEPAERPEDGEVLVSAGGGAVSEELFRAAFAARAMTRLSERTWRALVGHSLPAETFDALVADAPEGFIVARARPDFVSLLGRCACSISQGGYNTVMEVLAARTRGVIVPYAGGLETEQTLRAAILGPECGLRVVEEADVGPETIARAVDAAIDAPAPVLPAIDMSGAETTARLLREALAARPGRAA